MRSLTEIKRDFKECVRKHRMQILLNTGLYRHLKFSTPGTLINSFEIITWPGYLAYVGDCGSFVFQRNPDMFAFFGDNIHKINPHYWAEKVEALDKTSGIKQWSLKVLQDILTDMVRDHFEKPGDRKACKQALKESGLWDAENGYEAHNLAQDFEFQDFDLQDFWEVDCSEFTPRFIWCCFAIVWGIKQYRNQVKDTNA